MSTEKHKMKIFVHSMFTLTAFALFLCSQVHAQGTTATQDATDATAAEERPVPNSQEVEVNEDVYRQFMELKNARQQRNILPEDAFKPGSGSQKLDKLPEESQKHLRNQLREIIVQGAPWQPGDVGKNYPYVPSAAAADNQQLQKQEAEAWGELLDSYHKREAQIHENSARTAAAMAPENALNSNQPGGAAGQNAAQQGEGQTGSGKTAESQTQAKQESQDNAALANSSRVTSSTGTDGVSQNAMEFLKRMGSTGGPIDSENQAEDGTNEDTGSESGVGGPLDEPTQVTQQYPDSQSTAQDPSPDANTGQQAAESLAGTSQNALEFLKQNGDQAGEQSNDGTGDSPGESDNPGNAEEALAQASNSQAETNATETENSVSNQDATATTAGTSQNALEYLSGQQPPSPAGQEPDATNPGDPGGTLNISDLVNARGLGTDRNLSPPGNTPGGQGSAVKPPEKEDDS